MCAVLVYFLTLHISILKKKIVEGIKHRCVNKTSRDKGGACANLKQKRCNRIPSDITIDRNYAAWGYVVLVRVTRLKSQSASLYFNSVSNSI